MSADEFQLPDGAKAARASSLITWQDCPRRWMAQQRRRLLANLGFELASRPSSIGAHVGSGAHAAVGWTWEELTRSGELPPVTLADERGITKLRERAREDGVLFDPTTPNLNDAELAIRKMVRAYRDHMSASTRAIMVEAAMVGRVGGDWYLTGHCDAYLEQDLGLSPDGVPMSILRLDDFKTGVTIPAPVAQLGSYIWLGRARGLKPKAASVTFLRRTRRTADQPPPLVRTISPQLAERTARTVLGDLTAKVEAFETAADPDPLIIPCNPSSHLCTAKYCPAFRTRWCPESFLKPAGDDSNA